MICVQSSAGTTTTTTTVLQPAEPVPEETFKTRMWANAQRDGRPAEYRWRPLFNAAKFG